MSARENILRLGSGFVRSDLTEDAQRVATLAAASTAADPVLRDEHLSSGRINPEAEAREVIVEKVEILFGLFDRINVAFDQLHAAAPDNSRTTMRGSNPEAHRKHRDGESGVI